MSDELIKKSEMYNLSLKNDINQILMHNLPTEDVELKEEILRMAYTYRMDSTRSPTVKSVVSAAYYILSDKSQREVSEIFQSSTQAVKTNYKSICDHFDSYSYEDAQVDPKDSDRWEENKSKKEVMRDIVEIVGLERYDVAEYNHFKKSALIKIRNRLKEVN